MSLRPYLRCLGYPALYSPTGEQVRFRTKKHLALLVYLAVEVHRTHQRDRLAELLWPDVSLREGRHSLATALSILRPRLESGAISATREHVTLNGGSLDIDLDRLVAGEIIAPDTQEELEVAGFLEGFDIPHSAEFDLWKDRQRARLLPPTLAALIQQIDRCRRTADTARIERLADTMLALDELSEDAVRAKMEARAFAGDRLSALRIFEEWKLRLAHEVGAQPSALLEGMAIRLRHRGWERTILSDIPTVRTDQWLGRTFVGRSREFRLLYEAWEETKRGHASHVLLLGDSGVGKSTLVDRFTTAAGLEGAVTSRAQCYDLEQEIPYATLGNLVRELLDRPGISGTPPEALAEVALTFREVRRRFPTIPTAEERLGETARLRLTESLCVMLETIAEEHPVILVVDDLHLCDDSSLSVLHMIAHRVSKHPVMLVFVARPGELFRAPRAGQLRAGASSLGIIEIELSPLSDQEIGALLTALIGTSRPEVDGPLRRAMIRAAGGYPMTLELLVQDWEANGDASLALAIDAMTVDFGTSANAPPIYRQILERLIFALQIGTRQVLDVAAVLGHRLNDLTLYSIADLGQGQVMAAMAELVRHRVLRDGGRGLEFVNEIVRAAAYLEVPSLVRKALHARIAERLAEEQRRGVQFLGLEIAWHAIRAGRVAAAPAFLMKGAQEAIAQGALDSAARALETAIPQLASDDLSAATLLLVEVLQEQGRWAESARVLADNESARSSPLGVVLSMLAEHRTAASTGGRLIRDVRQLLAIVEGDSAHRVRLLAANAAAQLMGDTKDSTLSDSALASLSSIPEQALTEDERAQLALCRAQLLYYAAHPSAVSETLAQLAVSMRARGTINSTLVRVHSGLGVIRCYNGEYDQAKLEFDTARTIASQIGNEAQQVTSAANLALCCLRLGEYSEQLEWSKKASGTGFSRYQKLQVAYHQAFALALRGEVGEALLVVEGVDAAIPVESAPWLWQAWRLHRADILWLCGQHAEAMTRAHEAIDSPNPTLHASSFAGPFARWLALTSQENRTTADAARILEEFSRNLKEFHAIDRAEITCARLLVCESAVVATDLKSILIRQLTALPPATATHLRKLGALPF
jgi:DNA-binding SARP family transcriptional activator/tetratricopeptide (TPR) repeat protein